MMTLFPVHLRRTPREVQPWRSDLDDLMTQFDKMFTGFFDNAEAPALKGTTIPPIEVSDDENQITVRAELPGIDKKDFEVSLNDNLLTISGEKKEEEERKEKGYVYRETRYGSFHREVPVPRDIKSDKITADFKNGILTVTIPKSEESKERSRKIEIK